mgnify:CR=1 FL=1
MLGYGFIFISGIISDVVFGLPFGVYPLSLLAIAAVASYVRVVTIKITLINDWISFIPALLITNFIYFFSCWYLDKSKCWNICPDWYFCMARTDAMEPRLSIIMSREV